MHTRFSRTTLLVVVGAILVAVGVGIFMRSGNGEYEKFAVQRRDLVEEVVLSGTVKARVVATLGFEVSGTVQDILTAENRVVSRGTPLVVLSLGTLSAELQSAQANVAIKRAEVANTQIALDNAWSELLSDNLVAKPQSSNYTQTAPFISGRYVGEEGTYKFHVRPQKQPGKFDLFVFDLETVGAIEIEKTGPTPLGTRGLYVSFLDGPAAYSDTTWFVTLPNTEGPSYATNYSVYDRAKAELRAQQNGSSIAEAQLLRAEAEVARIQAQITQRTLTAPFGGTVTAVHINPGEAVSVNSPVVSLISNDGFGIEVNLPEIDSVKVKVGNPVSIMLDAFSGEVFEGTVVSVNRAATLVDNVSVYEARIAFNNRDERIASGMTAEVAITTNRSEDVLAVPVRAVKYREDGVQYVLTENPTDGSVSETDIVTGLRSSDGYFEVRSGISENNRVLVSY